METTNDYKNSRGAYSFDKLLVIRLVLSSVLFAVALAVTMPKVVSVIVLILAAAVSGYDIVIDAVNDVSAKNFFGAPLIITFSAVIAFAIGFGIEGAALVILFRIGLLLIDYASAHTKSSALDFIAENDNEALTHISLLFSNPDTGRTAQAEKVGRYMALAAKIIIALGVIYAIVLPLISDNSYTVSIHRALILFIVATPISLVSSLPLADMVGIGFMAANGVLYNSSTAFDAAGKTKTVIFDKEGVFTDGCPRVSTVKSDKLNPQAFVKMAAHVAYKSKQLWAQGVVKAYDGKIMEEITGDFTDLPGCGAEIRINGIPITLGTKELMDSVGAVVPEEDIHEGLVFYMALAGRYVGCLTMAENVDGDAPQVVSDMYGAGIDSCILLSGDGSQESAALAKELGIAEYFAGCDSDMKLSAVEQCRKSSRRGGVMYVYSNAAESHSAADIDVCMGASCPNADIFLSHGGLAWLFAAFSVSKRSGTIATENIIGTLAVKAIVIALCLTGLCNLWFAVFLDMAAALGAILNTIRVSMPPAFSFSKRGEAGDEEE